MRFERASPTDRTVSVHADSSLELGWKALSVLPRTELYRVTAEEIATFLCEEELEPRADHETGGDDGR